MSDIAIKVENLSKAYQLGDFSTGTISRDIDRWWARIRGKEDPFLKIGEANDRAIKGTSNIVWSLKDINLEIKQGDAIGIIGRNGAGKSTLLKVLSRITSPTQGNIKIKGRVASLLEVGTGFHPELSGRENIYLNGAILGMRKKEIARKFDEIVDFSGVERYIDTPVKRYSSGMYVRLAFAVAAYLESETLIVDEVLAVGDIEFQKKCLGKMNDVSKGEGRTVLFVSHNMGSILQLCNECILLDQGRVEKIGLPEDVVKDYYNKSVNQVSLFSGKESDIYIKQLFTCNSENEETSNFSHSEDINLRIVIGINNYDPIQNIGLALLTRDKRRVFTVNKALSEFYKAGDTEIIVDFSIAGGLIAPMNYSFLIALNTRTGLITYDMQDDICPVTVFDNGTEFAFAEGMDYGCIIVKDKWKRINS
ncbi:polysaccharide ABC transporter ATP-binding protein [Mucilaginibacter sp.]|jgi:lipopolysaccharide transport system ATP-binding protein|uniref:ABC transporter ATP-binding protein n=1 Tax=Mucilaginibacter sp. TaxID=1882438 RepID=UPI003562E47E